MSQQIPASTNPAIPMIVSKATIEKQATEAASQGKTINDACPYPFGTEAAEHFRAVYLLALPKGETTPQQGAKRHANA